MTCFFQEAPPSCPLFLGLKYSSPLPVTVPMVSSWLGPVMAEEPQRASRLGKSSAFLVSLVRKKKTWWSDHAQPAGGQSEGECGAEGRRQSSSGPCWDIPLPSQLPSLQ